LLDQMPDVVAQLTILPSSPIIDWPACGFGSLERIPIHILHPEGRSASAKIRAFVALAKAVLRENRFLN